MDLDLSKGTEIFLTPNSILVGALGVASTEPLKTGVSLLGLVSSALWLICSLDSSLESMRRKNPSVRQHILAWLPLLFIIGWSISAVVHGKAFVF